MVTLWNDQGMPPDRPAVPPTRRVVAALRARIDAGEWASGDHMPGTRELSQTYGVSTRTIAKAYKQLADEGLGVITPSWGTHRA